MAAGYVECILCVKNYKHGEDMNSEVTTALFILCSNYKYWEGVHQIEKRKQKFLWIVHRCKTKAVLSSSVCNCFSFSSETEMAGSSDK